MATITTTVDRLRRALDVTTPFASTDKTAPVLGNVQITTAGDRFEAASTDRYTASTYRLHKGEKAAGQDQEPEFSADEDAEILVPLATAKEILRAAKQHKGLAAHQEVTITTSADGAAVTFPGGDTYRVPPQEAAEYPKIARLFPKGTELATSEQGQILVSPAKLAAVAKAAQTLAERADGMRLRLHPRAGAPAVLSLPADDHWRAILMPMRG